MKTSVDFYILQGENFLQCFPAICPILEELYQQGHSLDVEMESESAAERFDQILWSFRDTSFVPHQIFQKSVKVANLKNIKTEAVIKVNLYLPSSPQAVLHPRLLQIVPNTPTLLAVARDHYRYYQQQHYQMTSHKLV